MDEDHVVDASGTFGRGTGGDDSESRGSHEQVGEERRGFQFHDELLKLKTIGLDRTGNATAPSQAARDWNPRFPSPRASFQFSDGLLKSSRRVRLIPWSRGAAPWQVRTRWPPQNPARALNARRRRKPRRRPPRRGPRSPSAD